MTTLGQRMEQDLAQEEPVTPQKVESQQELARLEWQTQPANRTA